MSLNSFVSRAMEQLPKAFTGLEDWAIEVFEDPIIFTVDAETFIFANTSFKDFAGETSVAPWAKRKIRENAYAPFHSMVLVELDPEGEPIDAIFFTTDEQQNAILMVSVSYDKKRGWNCATFGCNFNTEDRSKEISLYPTPNPDGRITQELLEFILYRCLWYLCMINRPQIVEYSEAEPHLAIEASFLENRQYDHHKISLKPKVTHLMMRQSMFPPKGKKGVRLHRVRGHWRCLTKFGERRIWIAPFYRGSAAVGTVSASYKI